MEKDFQITKPINSSKLQKSMTKTKVGRPAALKKSQEAFNTAQLVETPKNTKTEPNIFESTNRLFEQINQNTNNLQKITQRKTGDNFYQQEELTKTLKKQFKFWPNGDSYEGEMQEGLKHGNKNIII